MSDASVIIGYDRPFTWTEMYKCPWKQDKCIHMFWSDFQEEKCVHMS